MPKRTRALTLTRHREILRQVLLGRKLKDIANCLGYHPQSVYIVVNSDSFQAELAKIQKIVLDHSVDQMIRLNGIVPDAVKFYKAVLDEGSQYDAKIKFGVAKDLLDRVGLREPDRSVIEVHENDPARQIEEAYRKAKIIEAEVISEADDDIEDVDIAAEVKKRINGNGGEELEEQNDVSGIESIDPLRVFQEVREILGDEKIDVLVDEAVAGELDIIQEGELTDGEEAALFDSMVERTSAARE